MELRPLTEEVEREGKERGEVWERRRKVLIVALLCTISFLVSIAYSVVGSFFPIEVSKLARYIRFFTEQCIYKTGRHTLPHVFHV